MRDSARRATCRQARDSRVACPRRSHACPRRDGRGPGPVAKVGGEDKRKLASGRVRKRLQLRAPRSRPPRQAARDFEQESASVNSGSTSSRGACCRTRRSPRPCGFHSWTTTAQLEIKKSPRRGNLSATSGLARTSLIGHGSGHDSRPAHTSPERWGAMRWCHHPGPDKIPLDSLHACAACCLRQVRAGAIHGGGLQTC